MREVDRVTVSTHIGGKAAGNLRFENPGSCFIVEVMDNRGTIECIGFHHVTCALDKTCIVSLNGLEEKGDPR